MLCIWCRWARHYFLLCIVGLDTIFSDDETEKKISQVQIGVSKNSTAIAITKEDQNVIEGAVNALNDKVDANKQDTNQAVTNIYNQVKKHKGQIEEIIPQVQENTNIIKSAKRGDEPKEDRRVNLTIDNIGSNDLSSVKF